MKKTWILLVLAALLVFALAMPATAVDVTAPHCACGATTTGDTCATCKSPVYTNWQAWDVAANGNKLPTASGNYYIVSDATLVNDIMLANGTNIVIDFNGKTLTINNTETSKSRLYATSSSAPASVTVIDTTGTGGVIANGSIGGHGALFAFGTGSTLNIYGGTYAARDNVTLYGAAIYMKGNMNIYGGTIIGGTATKTGGGTICMEGGVLTMTGGTVKDGKFVKGADAYGGGNIVFLSGAKAYLSGGTISGGTATNAGGANLSVCATNCEIYIEGTNIMGGVTTGGNGGNIRLHSGKIYHSAGTISGGRTNQFGGNIWQENNANNHYYLSGTGTITGGHSGNGGGNVGLFNSASSFTMTGGSITNGTSDNGWGANLHVNGGGPTVKISAGTISGGSAKYGAMYIKGGTLEISGTANIDASTMTNVEAGAALCVDSAVTVNIKGGTIKGGTVSSNGGAIFASNGTWTISGGQIIGGTAGNCGGAMRLAGSAKVTMSAGTITGGTAKYGAAIAVEGGSFTMSNGTVNGGNVTGSCGGTISLDGGSVTISGGTVNGGNVPDSAGYGGGTFAIYGSGIMNVSGGTINAGTAKRGVCGYMIKGTLNITGGTIAAVSKFGGTLNVSKAPKAGIALGVNQFITVPSALTAGAEITFSSDNYTCKLAQFASKAIADSSKQYFTTYSNTTYVDADNALRIGAVVTSTDGTTWKNNSVWGITSVSSASKGIKLCGDITTANLSHLSNGTIVDLNGYKLTLSDANVDLSHILLVDSATADYESATGYGKLDANTVTGAPKRTGVDSTTKYRYVTILDASGNYSAHRIYVAIKSAILSPYGPSIYFKTVLKCDETIKALIASYGGTFIGDNTVNVASNLALNSGNASLNEFIIKGGSASAANFSKDFAAHAYFTLNDSWKTSAEKTITSSAMSRSVQSMVEYASSLYDTLNTYQKDALTALYKNNTAAMANGWAIEKLVAQNSNATTWNGTTLPTVSGVYVLGKGYNLTAAVKPANNAKIYLDLNGNTVNGPSAAPIFDFTGVTGASVVIYDSTLEKNGKLVTTADVVGAIANVAEGNTFTLLSGTLDATGTVVSGSGEGSFGAAINAAGKVYVHGGTIYGGQVNGTRVNHGGGAVDISGATALLKMTNGQNIGGTTGSNSYAVCGGNVLVQNSATFRMEGGTITGGKATYDGGNVFIWGSTFQMTGGTISNGQLGASARQGSNVCFSNTCTVTITDGTITGGNATGSTAYGGVYVNNTTTVYLSGNVQITGNTYNGKASNMYLDGGKVVIADAGLASTAKIGVDVNGGKGVFTTGNNVTVAASKCFTHDGGKGIIFAGTGTPLYCGDYGYQVGYAEGDYSSLCIGMGLNGYGNDSERIATSADSYGLDIEVLVVTDNEGDTAVICSVEAITMNGTLHTKLRNAISSAYNVPFNNIMITCNHQHSTPLPGSTSDYCDYAGFNAKFEDLFLETVDKAFRDRDVTTVYSYETATDGLSYIRNKKAYNSSGTYLGMVTDNHKDIGVKNVSYYMEEWAGDSNLQLVWFKRNTNKDIVLANFAVHPHGFASGSTTVANADFTGIFRSKVSSSYNCHTMYITAAAGDTNMTDGSNDLRHSNGTKVTASQTSALNYATKMAGYVPALSTSGGKWRALSTGQVTCAAETVTLNANEDKIALYDKALQIQQAGTLSQRNNKLKDLMNGVTNASQYIYSVYHADAIVNRYNYKNSGKTTRTLSAYAISIGDVSFGGIPYEMFSQDGRTVKNGDTHPATIICYLANGHNGYLPSTTHMNNGGYSADITYYAKGSSDTMNAKLIELLQEVDVAR